MQAQNLLEIKSCTEVEEDSSPSQRNIRLQRYHAQYQLHRRAFTRTKAVMFGTFYRCRGDLTPAIPPQIRLGSARKCNSALRLERRKSSRLVENRRSSVQWRKLQRSNPAHAAPEIRPEDTYAWPDCLNSHWSVAVLRQISSLPAKLGLLTRTQGAVALALAFVLWNAPAAIARSIFLPVCVAFVTLLAEDTRVASASARPDPLATSAPSCSIMFVDRRRPQNFSIEAMHNVTCRKFAW